MGYAIQLQSIHHVNMLMEFFCLMQAAAVERGCETPRFHSSSQQFALLSSKHYKKLFNLQETVLFRFVKTDCFTQCLRHYDHQLTNVQHTKYWRTESASKAPKKIHYFPPKRGKLFTHYFLQCLSVNFHLCRHFDVNSVREFKVSLGSAMAITSFSVRQRSHLRPPPLYG